ncbi:MAG: hypothetical protein K2I95_10295 [Treponemataceae bacterium]|nr:hypothetical protein [Treponemataceae bacterium]
MFVYEHSVSGKTTVRRIWSMYADADKWRLWDAGIDSAELPGGLAEGASGVMHMKDGAALPFTVIECRENEGFSAQAKLGALLVTLGHSIKADGDLVTITHTVTVEGGSDAQAEGALKAISSGIPESMRRLLAL